MKYGDVNVHLTLKMQKEASGELLTEGLMLLGVQLEELITPDANELVFIGFCEINSNYGLK